MYYKEIRLNDKFWFGKYKNKTIKYIIDHDFNYLNSFFHDGKIKYGENILNYLNNRRRSSARVFYRIENNESNDI